MSQRHRVAPSERPKLFDKLSPEEVWRQTLDLKCGKCGAPGVMQVRVFVPVDDLIKDMPGVAMTIAGKHDGQLPVVEFRGPGGEPRRFVRALHAVGCRNCRKEIELWAAKAPSYAVVEIDNGPGPIRAQVQV